MFGPKKPAENPQSEGEKRGWQGRDEKPAVADRSAIRKTNGSRSELRQTVDIVNRLGRLLYDKSGQKWRTLKRFLDQAIDHLAMGSGTTRIVT